MLQVPVCTNQLPAAHVSSMRVTLEALPAKRSRELGNSQTLVGLPRSSRRHWWFQMLFSHLPSGHQTWHAGKSSIQSHDFPSSKPRDFRWVFPASHVIARGCLESLSPPTSIFSSWFATMRQLRTKLRRAFFGV